MPPSCWPGPAAAGPDRADYGLILTLTVNESVNGCGKVDHMGGSIVGLRLSTVSESVLTNGQQKCHIHGIDFDPKEQARLQVLIGLLDEHMTLDQAAMLMGVTNSPHQAYPGSLPR